jgi:hypothetical protein
MLEYNAQYAGYIFGNAWGAVSAAAHCKAAKARKAENKNQYRLKNVEVQIAKFCEEARVEAEADALLFGPQDTGAGLPQMPAFVPPPMPGIGGEPDEGGIGLAIPLGIIGVLAVGGMASIFLLTGKKKKKKKSKKKKKA